MESTIGDWNPILYNKRVDFGQSLPTSQPLVKVVFFAIFFCKMMESTFVCMNLLVTCLFECNEQCFNCLLKLSLNEYEPRDMSLNE